MISEVETGEATSKKKRTRGPNTGKLLNDEVKNRGRLSLLRPDGRVDSEAGGKYSSRVGGVIRDKVPMLWPEWSEVPQTVKDRVNNAMTVSNLIRKHLIIF